MKRFLFALFLTGIIGACFAAWWFLRDTPEKVLRDGFTALINLKTAKSLVLDVSWTDSSSRTTTGFTYNGQADLKSWTRPRTLGVIRVGAAASEGQNQTGDMVIDDIAIALRPRSVSEGLRAYAESLAKDSTGETFLVISRDPFLEENGLAKAISNASAEDLMREANFIIPTLTPVGKIVRSTIAGRQTLVVDFTIDKKAIEPVWLELIKTWAGDNPTPDEYTWAEMASLSLGTGNFEITLDKKSRLPLKLKGIFSQLDGSGKETKKISFSLSLAGHGQKVEIGIPEKSKDVTEETIMKPQLKATLPQAKLRTLPGGTTSTATAKGQTAPTSTGKMIDEQGTDLFEKYYEEMLRKKNQQY